MRYLGGLHITLCPRYVGESGKDAAAQNLFAQAAFWNALHILIVSDRSISVELRLFSNSEDRTIGIYLLLAASGGSQSNDNEIVRLASQLMPKEYVCGRISLKELNSILNPPRPPQATWRIARIHRRTQYIDLPSLLPPTEKAAAASSSSTGPSTQFSLRLADQEGTRHLPEDIEDALNQMEFTRFCLPLLGDLREFPSDRRQLFEELQACAPAVISIGLHQFRPTDIEEDRQVATRFRTFVNILGGALANSGFAQLQSLQRVFDRYFLTQNHICISTVRVAALNDHHALSIGHQLCTWLGGMKAFHIIPPSRNIDRLGEVLANPEVEFPGTATSNDWTAAIDRLLSTMRSERIETPTDPRYNRFLVRLPHVYTVEEAAQLVRLPYGQEQGLPGIETRMLPPFFPSSQRYDPIEKEGQLSVASPDRIRIGRVNPSSSIPATRGSDQGLHWHSIPVRDLCKHALIVGSTGSGKTVTTLFLMRELVRLKIPFLVIEPVKTEYYDSLSNIPGLDAGDWKLKRFCFEGDITGRPSGDYLAFDPMRLQMGVTVSRHVSYLKSCFEAAFPLEAWQALFLENAMLDYYTAAPDKGGCGLQLFTRGNNTKLRIGPPDRLGNKLVYPSFETFSRYFLGTFLERELGKPSSNQSADRLEEMRQVFRRRFENLSKGPLGEAFRRADRETIANPRMYSHFSYLLRRPTIVELDAIPDGEQKSLVMAFLMTFLYERRQIDDLLRRERKDKSPRPDTEHILVVEEAHRLLANPTGTNRGESVGADSKTKAVSLFVDMLAEIRAFRQGLVIVEQIPTKLVPAAVKNTNLKIMLRLTSRDDRDYLGEAMSFNESQKQFVSFLRAERGNQVQYVAFDENVDQPILLSLPLRDAGPGNKDWLFDEYFPDTPGKEGQ